MRFDPTAAVSPIRIEQGAEAAFREDPAFLNEFLFSAMRLGGMGWINTLRLRFDALEYEWNRRVVNYNEEVQFELFEDLFGGVTESKVLLVLLGAAAIVILLVGLVVSKNRQKCATKACGQTLCILEQGIGKGGFAEGAW